MKTANTLIGAAIAAIGSLPAAQATPISITQTVSLGQLLQDNSTSVQFDVSGLLSGQGLSSQGIQSASLVVYGISDANYGVPATQYGGYNISGYGSHSVGYSYVAGYGGGCGWWSCYYYPIYGYAYYSVTDTNYLRSNDVTHVDSVADKLTVQAGASSASNTASVVSSSATSFGAQVSDGSGGDYYNGYQYYYSQYRDTYQAISGPLQVAMGLDAAGLADLALDGLLGIGVSAFGQFSLQSASLTFTVDQIVSTPSSTVPEPASIALSASALAALLVTRRRRRETKE